MQVGRAPKKVGDLPRHAGGASVRSQMLPARALSRFFELSPAAPRASPSLGWSATLISKPEPPVLPLLCLTDVFYVYFFFFSQQQRRTLSISSDACIAALAGLRASAGLAPAPVARAYFADNLGEMEVSGSFGSGPLSVIPFCHRIPITHGATSTTPSTREVAYERQEIDKR